MAPQLSVLGKGAWATFIYGASRDVVDRCAWAFARANDPAPFWLDIRADDGRADAGTPPDLGWINVDQLFVLAIADARPQASVGARTIASVIRSDESESVVAEFADFLRLPSAIQEVIGLHTGGPTRPAFVFANGDRVRSDYPKEPAGVRPIIDVLLHQGVLPIFTSTPPPGAGRMAFDFVFEVRASSLAEWKEGTLFCERAPSATGFEAGNGVPLASLPGIAAALDGRPTP